MVDAIVLIQSSDHHNRSIGTGFVIYLDEGGSYILTCSHVLNEVVSPKIEGTEAKVIANGSDQGIDLALLYLSDFQREALLLQRRACETQELKLVGYSPFTPEQYQSKTKRVTLLEEVKLQDKNNASMIKSWEIIAKEHYHIEHGNSGSPLLCSTTHKVIAVVSNNQTTQRGYAIAIEHLADIWEEMPSELWEQESQSKADFSQEVFEHLDTNPLLLFSTDSYNHVDYIEHIRHDAIERFGKAHILEINCGRFANIQEGDRFFARLAKKLKLSGEVKDSIDFEDALIDQFEAVAPLKSFILILGFERLHEDVRNAFAVSLRNLQEEYAQSFHLVIFGGEKLIQLKYSTGVHSYFNTFDQKMIPPPDWEAWQAKFATLSPQAYHAINSITGGYAKLTEYCLKRGATTQEEAQKILDESSWKSELFRLYRKDKLCLLFDKEDLGDAHPYSDNELLYRLYGDNLIVEQRGKFVWRSAFICELGRRFLGC